MRRTTRIAIYLCLVILVNEIGPAHFHRIRSHGRLSKRKHNDKDASANKRSLSSILGKVGKFIVQGLTYGSKFLEMTTTITIVITRFLDLVTQCCSGPFSEACTWTAEAKAIGAEIERNSTLINAIGLEIKNLEVAIMSASDEFNYTVNEMYRIGDASSRLLESLDPNVTLALKLTTNKLEKLMKEKNATGEKVEYITLETQYFGALDGVLGIAVPVFTSIIPAIPKLTKWIKARMGRYKSYELDHSVDAKAIQPPKKTDPRYKASKSWFGKQTSKIAYKVDKIKYTLDTKYTKALGVVKKIKQGFDISMSFVRTALNIYLLYKSFTKCSDAKDKAKEALDDMKEARDEMQQVYNGVIEARTTMRTARDQLYQDLKSEIFLNDLIELKNTLISITADGTDEDFREMLDEIDSYVNNIHNKDPEFVEVFHMIARLYQALGSVSYYIDCYTAKARVVRTVLDECKAGEGSIQRLNEKAKTVFESNADTCEGKIGMAPFSDDTLQTMIDKQSSEMDFNQNCEANNEFKQKQACLEYCKGTEESELPERVGVSQETITFFLRECKCEISNLQKVLICSLLSADKSVEEIRKLLNNRFTVEQINNVKCQESIR